MMWTRKEVKERAKEALQRNYWKTVFISFILILLGGGINPPSAASSSAGSHETSHGTPGTIILENDGELPFSPEETLPAQEMPAAKEEAADTMEEVVNAMEEAADTIEEATAGAISGWRISGLTLINATVWIAVTVVFIVVFVIVLSLILVIDIFLVNPLCIGANRFMLKSVDGTGNIAELGFTFDHNYKNGVKTAFFRDLSIGLWMLLFIIPGIYKKYQYYMVDYILAENPDMPYQAVLECSKRMMDGHKWNTFVLDLSFILWHMLSLFLTCGILEIFYVRPYINLTHAALYRTLCERTQGSYYRGIG